MFWSPFRNEDSGKSDKAEKGTKVMRRLSSLRSRVTGSWQKDKVREREKLNLWKELLNSSSRKADLTIGNS